MKLNKLISAMLLAMLALFTACEKPQLLMGEGEPTDTTSVDWSDVTLPEGAITVAEALKIGKALASGETTTDTYYIYGVVKKNTTSEATISSYGNQVFYMADKATDSDDFECYQVYNIGNKKFTALNQVEVGDRVIVYSKINNYNGTIETTSKGSAYVYWSDNKNNGTTPEPDPKPAGPVKYDTITVAKALEIANALELGKSSDKCYICIGTVETVLTAADKVASYGNINFNLKDETGTIGCFYTYYLDSVSFTSADQLPAVGSRVVIAGKLKNYAKSGATTGTPEFANAYFLEMAASEPEPAVAKDTVRHDGNGASPEVFDFTQNLLNQTADTVVYKKAENPDSPVILMGGVSFEADGSGSAYGVKFIKGVMFQLYQGTTFTLKAPEGKKITAVAFEDMGGKSKGADNLTADKGTMDKASKSWSGSESVLVFKASKQVRLKKITVTYGD